MNNTELRRIRLAMGLTRKNLADRIGLSLSSLEKYEAGTREIPLKVELAIEALQKRRKA